MEYRMGYRETRLQGWYEIICCTLCPPGHRAAWAFPDGMSFHLFSPVDAAVL